ncbi:MAG: hypothetical protein H7X91_02750 [Burkholderiales bacterium]|nr:hypothetical protein [Burkholderiales bacterium]
MPALFHANVKIEGQPHDLAAFKTALAPLLLEHAGAANITESQSDSSLSYDVKAIGGIPFPPFVIASEMHPALAIAISWINTEANLRGAATIVNGALTEQKIDDLPDIDSSSRFFISTAADGSLELALTFFQAGADEYCGYALTANEDALFRVTRDRQQNTVELLATAGAAEWAEQWSIDSTGAAQYCALEPPRAIDTRLYDEASQLMAEFIARWIWFAADPPDQIIIEQARCERLGYAQHAANLKSAQVAKLQPVEGGAQIKRLGADTEWVKDVLARYWLDPSAQE